MTESEEFLAHYGVLGMKWGVRRDRKRSSVDRAAANRKRLAELKGEDVKVLGTMFPDGVDPVAQHAKYGPGSLSGENDSSGGGGFQLTENQLLALKVGGVALAGAALYFGMRELNYHVGPFENISPNTKQFFRDQDKNRRRRSLKDLPTEAVDLKPGSIIKRISTEKESIISDKGFCAAHKDADVERYKAALPIFWKMWGADKGTGGHVVNIRADKGVKAPSVRDTLDLYNEWVGSKGSGSRGFKANDSKGFYQLAQNASLRGTPSGDGFLSFLQSKGYNAMIDINDAGALGEQPLRIIGNDGFSIQGHTRLTPNQISKAQSSVQRIAHMLYDILNKGARMGDSDAFLAHYGVKGMKWGVRRKRPSRSKTGAAKGNKIGTRQYDARTMSTKELQSVVNRMRLEQDYAKLNAPTKKSNSFIKNFISTNGNAIASGVVMGAAGVAIPSLIRKAGSGEDGQASQIADMVGKRLTPRKK